MLIFLLEKFSIINLKVSKSILESLFCEKILIAGLSWSSRLSELRVEEFDLDRIFGFFVVLSWLPSFFTLDFSVSVVLGLLG